MSPGLLALLAAATSLPTPTIQQQTCPKIYEARGSPNTQRTVCVRSAQTVKLEPLGAIPPFETYWALLFSSFQPSAEPSRLESSDSSTALFLLDSIASRPAPSV